MTGTDIVPTPEAKAAIADARTIAALTAEYKVTTVAEQIEAAELLQRVKGAAKRLLERRKAITDPMDLAKKNAMALFAPPTAELEAAEARIKRAIAIYVDGQERERRRLQAEAEEKARKERERLEAQAARAEAAGKAEKAEQLVERAATVTAPVVAAEVAKVSGVATRKVWKFQITDPAAIPREYLIVDETRIGKIVRAMQGDTNIPGVKVYAETDVASRSK
jgi:hypothetical protein